MILEQWPSHRESAEKLSTLMKMVEEETGGEWTEQDAQEWMATGCLTLAVAAEVIADQSGSEPLALCGMMIKRYKNGRTVGDVPFLAGQKMDHWLPLFPILKGWMRSRGAELVRIQGREGWLRKFKDDPSLKVRRIVFDMELGE